MLTASALAWLHAEHASTSPHPLWRHLATPTQGQSPLHLKQRRPLIWLCLTSSEPFVSIRSPLDSVDCRRHTLERCSSTVDFLLHASGDTGTLPTLAPHTDPLGGAISRSGIHLKLPGTELIGSSMILWLALDLQR